jgi:cyclophilin family peptidyl-prolyl cis-trans isomerase
MASPFKRVCACFWVGLRSLPGVARPCPAHLELNRRAIATVQLASVALALCTSTARADSFVELDYNIFLSNRVRSTVFIQLFDDRPLTVANFLQYVNGSYYDDTMMHRLALDSTTHLPFVLQGGGYYPNYLTEPAPLDVSLNPNAVVDLDGIPSTANPTVVNEFNNAPPRSNVKGTIAMAKLGADPNSASNQWFFNLNDNSANLDTQNGGFTVFGQVVGDGMSLINAVTTLSTGANGMHLLNMNPDVNDDGTRDSGPFQELPALVNGSSFLPLILNRAHVVDYYGSTRITDVPASGLPFANNDVFIDTGTTFTGAGGLTIGVGRTLGIREGYSLNRPLSNHGTVAPGLTLGSVTLQSTYLQYSDGTLNIDLGGTTADTGYDQLKTISTAFLAGRLHISIIPGFAPTGGQTFTLLTASSIVGSFGAVDLPQLTPGLVWNLGQTSTAVTLSVVGGDYNDDGIVDDADYVVWRKARNTSVATAYSGADGNGDALVNDLDYQVWRLNLGRVSGGNLVFSGAGSLGPATVPEPASVLIAGIAMSLISLRRRAHTG